MKSNEWQPRILWVAVLLLGVGTASSLIFWDRADDDSSLLADEVLITVSNRFRLFDSATRKFEKSTTSISHLKPVKAAQTQLQKKRDEALIRYLQETVDRSLPSGRSTTASEPNSDTTEKPIGHSN